jgi:hypothetical protein
MEILTCGKTIYALCDPRAIKTVLWKGNAVELVALHSAAQPGVQEMPHKPFVPPALKRAELSQRDNCHHAIGFLS